MSRWGLCKPPRPEPRPPPQTKQEGSVIKKKNPSATSDDHGIPTPVLINKSKRDGNRARVGGEDGGVYIGGGIYRYVVLPFYFWPKKTVTKRKNIQRYNHRSIGTIYRFLSGRSDPRLSASSCRVASRGALRLYNHAGAVVSREHRGTLVGVADKGGRDRSYPGEEGVQSPYPRTAVMAPR
ncbi:hypothetical protein GW17_00035193 [Ensete ventricosum]|nr:hypothetical protein GW17_00035193 [Ensete ventricosum]RZS27766.1 hypothetical protein BHM03_00061288 [Ensete ventricosum]